MPERESISIIVIGQSERKECKAGRCMGRIAICAQTFCKTAEDFQEAALSGKRSILWSLAVQVLGMAVLAAVAALSGLVLTGRALARVHGGCIWLLAPLAGFWLSMRCAKAGVPAMLAWPLAPGCFAAVYWAIVGMAPSLGAACVCALLCIVGGAAGEVWLKRNVK